MYFPFWGQNIATNIQLLFVKLHDCNFLVSIKFKYFMKGKENLPFALAVRTPYVVRSDVTQT